MPKLPKRVRTMVADVRDAKKKLSPHQDPRSKKSAALRFAMDNPKKATKKSPSPHTNGSTKKRTRRDQVKPGPKLGSKSAGATGGIAKKDRVKRELGGPAGSRLGDLNKDGKMSGYEKKRQAAITESMQKRATMQKPMTKKLSQKGPAGKPIATKRRGKRT